MIDKKELRELAELAFEVGGFSCYSDFHTAANPTRVIELLDLVDELSAECARLKLGWDASHKNYVKAVTRD